MKRANQPYKSVTPYPVDMATLRRVILTMERLPYHRDKDNKLPLDLERTYYSMPVNTSKWFYRENGDSTFMGNFDIVVKAHVPHTNVNRWTNKPQKSSKHRIFIKIGDRLIPAGRAAQAKA